MATTRKNEGLGDDEVRELRDKFAEHMWLPYSTVAAGRDPDQVHVWVGGKGCRNTDSEGRTFFDCHSGHSSKNVGFGRTEIADAAYAQMMIETSGFDIGTAPAIKLAAKLAEITPGSLSRTCFACSGSEANEVAVKMAKQYQRLSGFGNRHKIIARMNEYHGFTHMALAMGRARPLNLGYFEPLVPGVSHIPQPYCYRCPLGIEYPGCGVACARELEGVIQHEGPELVAAMMVTAIGHITPVTIPPPEYWPMIKSICDKYGVLLIDDEVICGFGRTGKMFAMEHFGIVPDMITVAKSFTGGYLPLSACICTPEISNRFEESDVPFQQYATFGALPACCAAAQANIEIIENEKLVENAAAMGEYFREKAQALYEHPTVGDIRGIGLTWCIELVKDRKTKERISGKEGADMTRKFHDAGFLLGAGGGIISFFPPLVITRDEIDECLAVIEKAIGEMESESLSH
ncbi:MAG: aminotransferase family protein [Candidatus Bathyanammoxibius sp.]